MKFIASQRFISGTVSRFLRPGDYVSDQLNFFGRRLPMSVSPIGIYRCCNDTALAVLVHDHSGLAVCSPPKQCRGSRRIIGRIENSYPYWVNTMSVPPFFTYSSDCHLKKRKSAADWGMPIIVEFELEKNLDSRGKKKPA